MLHRQPTLKEVCLSLKYIVDKATATGFDWSLHFKWDTMTTQMKAARSSPIEPIKLAPQVLYEASHDICKDSNDCWGTLFSEQKMV